MSEFLDFFKLKKNLVSVLILGILILALPLGITLLQKQQNIKSRANVDPIVFSGNVEQRNGNWVATKSQVSLELTSPLGPPEGENSPIPGNTLPSSPPSTPYAPPTIAPTSVPTAVPTNNSSCPNKLIFGLNGPVTDKLKQLYTHPSIRFIPVAWKDIQPNQNSPFDFTSTDKQVNDAIADGQTPAIKFCDGDCFPDWARQMNTPIDRAYCCSSDVVCRILKEDQTSVGLFQGAVSVLATRYKDKVTQWDYGIEPNCRGYNPTRYTYWLKYFSQAVRFANPNAVVVGGHISGANTDYLQAMYAAGAKPYFDRLALDPYGDPLDYAGLERIRNLMVSQNDSNKKIWLGEWGIATNNDEAKQASLVSQGLTYLASKPWIEAAFYHNYECELWTNSCSPGTPGYLGFGLLRSDGSEKAVYNVFKQAVNSCGG